MHRDTDHRPTSRSWIDTPASVSFTVPGLVLAVLLLLLTSCASGGSGQRVATTEAPSSTTSTSLSRPSTTVAQARADAGSTTTTTPPVTTAAPSPTAATTTTAPTTTTTTTTTTTAPAAPGPQEAGDLAGGAEGPRTQALQVALVAQKYDPGPTDGQFGLKTTQSVWAWQSLHGIDPTGVVDAVTERLILALPAQPMLRADLGPSHTEIYLARQVLVLFQGGQVRLITHVSTGSGRHYCDKGNCGTAVTPPGTFHYGRRVDGWRHAPLGLLYNPVYFNGGIAVHGGPSVPNYPASHGCVRIPMHIAEYFPSLVAKGDSVVVV